MKRALTAATAAVALLGAAPAGAESVEELHARLAAAMEEQVEAGFSGVVYVAMGGEVLLYEGYGLADRKTGRMFTRDTIVDANSLSKQVTAAAAMMLVSQGRLSLDDTVGDYYPEAGPDKAPITVRQLLSHSSGIEGWVFPDDFTPIPQDAWLQMVFSTPLHHPTGTDYLYSNDGITLVAIIIERITGMGFRDYVHETFFAPLGMAHSGWYDDPVFQQPDVLHATAYRNGKDNGSPEEWIPPSWALLGNGGILWTIDDMVKWHTAVHGGLLPAEFREQLFTPVIGDPEDFLYENETAPASYALAWRVGTSPCGDARISHTGTGVGHNVDYRYYRTRDLLVYAGSNKIDADYLGNETIYSREAAKALTAVMMDGCPTLDD